MRIAVILLAVVSAIGAEAPYHLPRPAPHAPPFGYPSGPAPPPPQPPYPQLPQHRPQPFAPYPQPAPQPSYPSNGYNYQQPSIGPAFVYPAPQSIPQPIPAYSPPHIHYPAPQPPPQPRPQPLPISYPQPQPHYPQPQPQLLPNYPQPQAQLPLPTPQINYGVPQPQTQSQPQPLPQPLPNFAYNSPAPVAPLPAPVSLQSQGYQYQQSFSQYPQFAAALPLQSQPLTNTGVSSYQADSSQYSSAQAQTHRDALDETVVNRVQNIIRENEHSAARNAGYHSLVSGVSLESAKPSVELSSFVHTSPLNNEGEGLIDVRTASRGTTLSSSSAGAVSISSGYDSPQPSAGSSQSSDSSASFGFLPSHKPNGSYGTPN